MRNTIRTFWAQWRSAAWIAVAGVAMTPTVALCDDKPDPLHDPFRISLGAYVLTSSTDISLNGQTAPGTKVDWNKTFGDDTPTIFRLDAYWRFAERHKVTALVFSTSRSNTRTIGEDIQWGDDLFPAGANVKGKFEFDIYELAYEYSFLRRENYELNANIGVHYAKIKATLSAAADASNGTLEKSISQTGDLGAPLPVIGVSGTWRLPHDLSLAASAQFFSLNINEYSGSLQDYRVSLTWQPKRWLGFGLGYDRFHVNVTVDRSSFNGSLDWSYQGPQIYYSALV